MTLQLRSRSFLFAQSPRYFRLFQVVPCPLSCAFVRAVIIDCFSPAHNCFIAGNWLSVVTDLIASSYLGFTYSIPGYSLGHLSFLHQMIWWQCTTIQVFIIQQMMWPFFFAATSQKRDKIGKCCHYCTSRSLSGRREGKFPKLYCTTVQLEDLLWGSPSLCAAGMTALHHLSSQPCFHTASDRSSEAPSLSCLPGIQWKKSEVYLELTVTLTPGDVRLLYNFWKEFIFFPFELLNSINRMMTVSNCKGVALISLMGQIIVVNVHFLAQWNSVGLFDCPPPRSKSI